MRSVVACWRIARVSLHVLRGVWLALYRLPKLMPDARHAVVRAWSREALRRLGIELQTDGDTGIDPRGMLIVANHVSWLDIAAIHSVLPQARFVSKADVKTWPVLGTLVAAAGTLFIERANKRDALRVVHQTAAALKNGDCVAVFPEGTTGPGPELLPFHANLLQAAIAVEAPLLPVVLRWHEPSQRFSAAAQYIGDTTLGQSLWRVARARGLGVSVQVLPALPSEATERRALARTARQCIAERLS